MNKVKPTIKQKRVVENLIENRCHTLKEAMLDAGYSENSAINPENNVLKAKGFKQLMNELGLTEEFLTTALKEDISNKPGKRAEELKIGFKLKGLLNDKVEITAPNITIVDFKKPEEK